MTFDPASAKEISAMIKEFAIALSIHCYQTYAHLTKKAKPPPKERVKSESEYNDVKSEMEFGPEIPFTQKLLDEFVDERIQEASNEYLASRL